MRSCWNKDPDKRLTFSQLNKTLNQLDREIQVNYLNKLEQREIIMNLTYIKYENKSTSSTKNKQHTDF